MVDEQAERDRSPHRLAILVSGSGTNLQALLDAIEADASFGGEISVVGTDQPDCLALERAQRSDVPTVATALDEHPDRGTWERHLVDALTEHRPDIIVLAGFMRVLSERSVARWPQHIVNVHPSLLPAFPGAHAVRDALNYGVKVTGSTVHLVDEQVDHGPIIAQRAVEVLPEDDETSLHRRIQRVEYQLLPAAVKLLCHDRIALRGRRVVIEPASRAEALTVLDLEYDEHA